MYTLGDDILYKIVKKSDKDVLILQGQSSKKLRQMVKKRIERDDGYKEIEEVLKKLDIDIDPIKYIILNIKERCVICNEKCKKEDIKERDLGKEVIKGGRIYICGECVSKQYKLQTTGIEQAKSILGQKNEKEYKSKRAIEYKKHSKRGEYIIKEMEEQIQEQKNKGEDVQKKIEKLEKKKWLSKEKMKRIKERNKRLELDEIFSKIAGIECNIRDYGGLKIYKEHVKKEKTKEELQEQVRKYKEIYEEEREKYKKDIEREKKKILEETEAGSNLVLKAQILKYITEKYDIEVCSEQNIQYMNNENQGLKKIIKLGQKQKIQRKREDQEGEKMKEKIKNTMEEKYKGENSKALNMAKKYVQDLIGRDGSQREILMHASIFLLIERGSIGIYPDKKLYMKKIYYEENKDET